MSRPKKPKTLVEKLCTVVKTVGCVPRKGRNTKYPYQRASDIAEVFRSELFKQGILILPDEKKTEYVEIGRSNGGDQLWECRLEIEFEFTDGVSSIKKMANGVGRDVEDKGLYKAKTGAVKYLLKAVGLIPDDGDDAEFDGTGPQSYEADTDQVGTKKRTPKKQQPVREFEIAGFNEACVATGKTADETAGYLGAHFKISAIGELKQRDFPAAIRWASNGSGTLAPKTQGGGVQAKMFPAPPPVELRIGNKSVEIPQQKDAFAL